MTPITREPVAIRNAPALLALTQRQLDELFEAAPVGSIPVGAGDGTALVAPQTLFGAIARHLIRLFVWKGKVFRPETSDLKNRLTPFGIPGIRAKVYVDRSWKAEGDAIILDYSRTSFVARFIRDEMREVGPGVYLGKVFMGRKHVLDFSLSFGHRS